VELAQLRLSLRFACDPLIMLSLPFSISSIIVGADVLDISDEYHRLI